VYRFDKRFPEKQKIAVQILRQGILEDTVRVPHQAIVEFVAAVTRSVRGYRLAPAVRFDPGSPCFRQTTAGTITFNLQ
jgi:hypothetical protein